jgi:putative hydrolase of the HAD superfamily
VRTEEPSEIFKRILEVHGVRVPLDDIRKVHGESQKDFDGRKLAEIGADYWVRWNLKILARIGVNKKREFLARRIDQLWFEYSGLEVYPEVMKTVAQLRTMHMKTGIVTNGLTSDIQKVEQKLGLLVLFDVAIGADACRKAKPTKEIFHFAVSKLGVLPGEAIYVGDSVKLDYQGAKAAGLKPLLINRNGPAPADVDAIANLTEIFKYLDRNQI